MRSLGDTLAPGQRASDSGPPTAPPPPRMTYTGPIDESTLNDALQQPLSTFAHGLRDPRKQPAHEAGAAGPADLAPTSQSRRGAAHRRVPSARSTTSSVLNIGDDSDDASWTSDSPMLRHKVGSPLLTPMLLASGPASAVSGASSPRGSLVTSLFGDTDSQGLSAGEEMEAESSTMPDGNSSSVQLVMPSIKMPSRRPFTEKGKQMGRLKVLLAGNSGVGKTALINAIAQTADAIVHVDPIPSPPPARTRRSSSRGPARFTSSRHNSHATKQISEIFASTKPLPEWWSELGEAPGSRRSNVGDDAILDRNICFIDTPGYSGGASSMDTITPTVNYVESAFEVVSTNGSTDPDMLKMLGGDGGNQVDAVLYLIKTKLRPADIRYLQLLTSLTNVIPVIAQADTMSPDDIARCKSHIRCELQRADICPFSFKDEPNWPYAVSSLPGLDHDIMDASVLMSPDYLQPLVASELASLTEKMFCENGASWLKHAAAQKYIHWKASGCSSRPRALPRSLTAPAGPPTMNSLVAVGLQASPTGLIDLELQEERLARIRLSSWASRLQSSLRREQAQYEAIARGERNNWLLEKLTENVLDGRIVAVRDTAPTCRDVEHRASDMVAKRLGTLSSNRRDTSTELHQDPLGLVQVSANVRARSWEAVRMLGGVSLLGGLAFWAARQGWYAQVVRWTAEAWDDQR